MARLEKQIQEVCIPKRMPNRDKYKGYQPVIHVETGKALLIKGHQANGIVLN